MAWPRIRSISDRANTWISYFSKISKIVAYFTNLRIWLFHGPRKVSRLISPTQELTNDLVKLSVEVADKHCNEHLLTCSFFISRFSSDSYFSFWFKFVAFWTFFQISSNASQPSPTFFRQRSTSPKIKSTTDTKTYTVILFFSNIIHTRRAVTTYRKILDISPGLI